MKRILTLSAMLLCMASPLLKADEGMWLPALISQRIGDMQAKGFKLSAEDVYSVNQASLKDAVVLFGSGCTGELVSADGLLFTNHHCGYSYIQKHSSVEHDYLKDGFWAMTRADELPNPGLTVRFLERMEDVTAQVLKGYKAKMTEDGTILIEDARQTKSFKVTKKWVDASGKAVAWPKDSKVTVEVYANGKPLDKASAEMFGAIGRMTLELSATKTSGTFTGLPVYKGVKYTVVETGVTNVTDKFAATTTGDTDKGFTVTNTFEKKAEKKTTTTTTTSSSKLAKTGDPTAAAGLVTLCLSGIGTALATGGAIIRKRRRDDDRD